MGGKTSFVKIGVAMMIALLFTNIIMMVTLHEHANDTTVILKEYRKISDDTSGSDLAKIRKGYRSRDKYNQGDTKSGGRTHGKESEDGLNRASAAVKSNYFNGGGRGEKGVNGDPRKAEERSRGIKKGKHRFAYNREENIDIEKMIKMLNSSRLESFFPISFWTDDFPRIVYNLGRRKKSTGSGLSNVKRVNKSAPNWQKFHANIRRYALYDPNDPVIDALLDDMANLPITKTDDTDGGTELKVIIEFKDRGRAIMKPMRYPRDWPINPNLYVFSDIERHIAEIAAFHLDRLLGFGRVPPTVGRKINLTEFKDLAPRSLSETYYKSPAGNTCFFGKCLYFCDSATPFCGNPDVIETSMMAYLPSRLLVKRSTWYQPYRRAYSKRKKADWEKDEMFCDTVKKTYPFNTGKLLLDMIDAHTFDFLNGNKDRHSFSVFKEFGNFSFPILFDNGRGYGRLGYDPMSILAPLRQCCIIRKSTFIKYSKLYTGPVPLSSYMEQSLAKDPVAPVLIDGNLEALDRRLLKILKTVASCIEKYSVQKVIIDDKY